MKRALCAAGVLFACLSGGSAVADLISIVDNLPGTFVDISATGTNLHLNDEDEAEITTTIGNTLLPAGRVIVANNGGLGFDPPDTNLPPDNEPIRDDSVFGGGQALLGYWDDIGNDVGGVFYEEQGNMLIVQWENRAIGGRRDVRITFQIQIFEQTEANTPYFQFLYEDISAAGGGASATIGYQDGGAGFEDETWSFNTPGAVRDGGVLTVAPEPAALVLLGLSSITRRRRA
jgi:hypothetical protein